MNQKYKILLLRYCMWFHFRRFRSLNWRQIRKKKNHEADFCPFINKQPNCVLNEQFFRYYNYYYIVQKYLLFFTNWRHICKAENKESPRNSPRLPPAAKTKLLKSYTSGTRDFADFSDKQNSLNPVCKQLSKTHFYRHTPSILFHFWRILRDQLLNN